MESSIGKLIYCCISKKKRILYSYNGGDEAVEALASLCIEKTPAFHSNYFHTAGSRTFGFLIDETFTYFAIIDDPIASNNNNKKEKKKKKKKKKLLLHLLHQIKTSFKSNNNFDEELIPIIKRLICSLDSMNHSSHPHSIGSDASTKAPLLCVERRGSGRMESSTAAPEVEVVIGNDGMMQKSLSFGNRSRQTGGRKLWLRHVKIVIVVDIFLCVILFGVWLAVCKGFQCVS